jgi:hypothetical protein
VPDTSFERYWRRESSAEGGKLKLETGIECRRREIEADDGNFLEEAGKCSQSC